MKTDESRVSAVLRSKWDPIGLGDDGPADEYDAAAAGAVVIWRLNFPLEGESFATALLAAYLTWYRCTKMGLDTVGGCAYDGRAAVHVAKELLWGAR